LSSSIYVIHKARKIVLINNDSIAITGMSMEVLIWDIKTKSQIARLVGHWSCTWGLVKMKDGLLASGSSADFDWGTWGALFYSDRSIKIWNYTKGRLVKNLTGHRGDVFDLVSLSKEILISCSQDSTIRFWNTISGVVVNKFQGHENSVLCIILVSCNVLASGSADKTIRLWNLTSLHSNTTARQYTQTPSDYLDIVDCLLLLNNGTHLASGNRDFSIKILIIEAKLSLVASLQGHTEDVLSLVNLKQGHLASASSDLTIKIWNWESLEYGVALLATLKGHSDTVVSLVLLPNGFLASASWDQSVKTWNLPAIYNYPNRSNLIVSVDD
jgi:WD40 repeat protein